MPILALHGFTGCGEDFAGFSKLCATGEEWICPELPGHGADPSLDCTPAAVLRHVHSFAARMGEPRILLGYSMGARAALLHAIRSPGFWEALVLISVNPGIEEADERTARMQSDEALARRIEADGTELFLEFWQNSPLIRSQRNIRRDWLRQMRSNRRQHTPEGLAASLRGFGPAACPDLWPELASIGCSTLLLCGEDDSKYRAIAARMSGSFHNAGVEVVSRAGHAPHLEQPERTAHFVSRFLALI